MTSHSAPIPCAHIADYYNLLWERHKCIAWAFLRCGYAQCARGGWIDPANNLYSSD